MKNRPTVRYILIGISLLILLAALHYSLPQVDVVRAVGVEIKRLDVKETDAAQNRTRDVYYLQMQTPSGDPKVYRNEDNFLYGKFDSADLQAQVQSFASDKQLVALRHYGWRLTLFSTFPNAVKAWPVEEGYRHIPVFNILVLTSLGLLILFGVRRVSKAMAKSRQAAAVERVARETAVSRDAQNTADLSRQTVRKKDDEVSSFLNSDDRKQD